MKKLFLLLFSMITSLSILFFYYSKSDDIYDFNKHFEKFHIKYPFDASVALYKNIADIVYSVETNKDDVTVHLYKASQTKDKAVQKIERDKLYKELLPLYTHLKKLGIKQYHFHFKDATSFLRFHKPKKFGDNLTNIRSTILYANQHQCFVQGFEEGRIFNGYRFVYPLYYKKEHVGSVEISIGFSSLAKTLNKNFAIQTYMMLSKDVVEHKLFSNERRNYSPSYLSKNFYHESNTYDNITKFTKDNKIFTQQRIEKIFQKYNNKIEANLQKNKRFFFFDTIENINYVVYFIPIKNFKKQNIGYMLFLNKSNIFEKLEQSFLYKSLFAVLFFATFFSFIYFIQTRNRALKQSEARARYAAQSKSDFLANMSHEIRTPLNAIFGYLNLLEKTIKSAKEKEYLEIIASSSATLLNVINDILDFSKIESKKFELSPIPFRTQHEMENLYKMFLPLTEKKSIQFHFHTKNLPLCVHGDILRLKQVITNLLSNAIKFTPQNGTVDLDINYKGNLLYVGVTDNGIGIKELALKNIFQEFTQADNSTTRKFGGTGLGLSISKHIVELFGGELKVKSIYGEGSTFYFEIPLVVCDEDALETEDEESTVSGECKGNILLVEDNKTNQMLMEIILEELGLDVTIANDGIEAIEHFKEQSYDIIFMDENMPNMNGIEATKNILELQKNEGYEKIPIIALTADAVDGAKEKYLQAGMQDYLTKPLEEKKLISVLQKYLKTEREKNN